MRIFERRALIARLLMAGMAGSLAAVWNCGSSTTCLRYSDCNQGLTCANGLCVIAGDGDGDAGDGGEEVESDGSTTTTTPTTDAAVAAVDSGSSSVDDAAAAATGTGDEDASRDASIADASSD
jgi:hypothetical protein